jgi:peptidoglycan/xylan/chitin deacetylase (PgdA/CDA1 family)
MKLYLSHLLPKRAGVPILMYHKVETTSPDSLTVSISDFKSQLLWLKNAGYEAIRLQSFLDVLHGVKKRSELPKRPVLITFDDGYASTLKEASPILKEFGFCATLFATSSFIAGDAGAAKPDAPFMTPEDLKIWNQEGHDIALHSHLHPNYRALKNTEIVHDLKANQDWFKAQNIFVLPALAYPYGARPKEPVRNEALKQSLQRQGVVAAFRIGNKIATWSSLRKKHYDRFEIPRIDIRGDDTIASFAIKVQKGRLRPFQ